MIKGTKHLLEIINTTRTLFINEDTIQMYLIYFLFTCSWFWCEVSILQGNLKQLFYSTNATLLILRPFLDTYISQWIPIFIYHTSCFSSHKSQYKSFMLTLSRCNSWGVTNVPSDILFMIRVSAWSWIILLKLHTNVWHEIPHAELRKNSRRR